MSPKYQASISKQPCTGKQKTTQGHPQLPSMLQRSKAEGQALWAKTLLFLPYSLCVSPFYGEVIILNLPPYLNFRGNRSYCHKSRTTATLQQIPVVREARKSVQLKQVSLVISKRERSTESAHQMVNAHAGVQIR